MAEAIPCHCRRSRFTTKLIESMDNDTLDDYGWMDPDSYLEMAYNLAGFNDVEGEGEDRGADDNSDDDDDDDLYLDPENEDEVVEFDDDDDDFVDMDDDDEDEDEDEDEDDEENGPTFVINVDDDGNLPDAMSLVQQLLSQPQVDAEPTENQRTFRLSTTFLRHLLGSSPQAMRAVMAGREQPDPVDTAPWWHVETQGNPIGKALLHSGEFGTVGRADDVLDLRARGAKRKRAASRPEDMCDVKRSIHRRQRAMVGTTWPGRRRLEIGQETVPNSPGTVVAQYPSIPYIGQYSHDYDTFYTATQSFTLHLYSTKATRSVQAQGPVDPVSRASRRASRRMAADDDDDFGEDSSMRKIKTVQGVEGRWTVTDAEMSRDGRKMIYSSITPFVHMLDTAEHESEHVELDFTDASRRRGWSGDSNFGIWSVRFSADGKEIVAGCGNGNIMVYDLESNRRILSVPGHGDDVNAVCFADENSTNILVSGSDDGYVKVWDRRSLSSSTPSGVLVGATEGITYVSPKGDGRYIIANSKDQAVRLYDLRRMRQWEDYKDEKDAVSIYGNRRFDYRHMPYAKPKHLAHPQDSSVMTYRGHAVLGTLIRCHFSPDVSTGQNYIYSGSADGMIHIWSLDGRVVQVLNRGNALPLRSRDTGTYSDPSSPDPAATSPSSRRRTTYQSMYDMDTSHTVRDVSWHGLEPTLMSTSWESEHGYRRGGTLAKHEWKGLGKNGLRTLEDWVERERA